MPISAGKRKNHRELAKANARLNGIIFSAMDAIVSLDSDQRIVLFNPAAERMFGVTVQEVLGQSVNRLIPERFREAHTRHVEQFGKTGTTMRRIGGLGVINGLRANGEEFPIEASISQVELDGEKLFTVVLRDVSERVRNEEALQESQGQLSRAKAELEERVQERTLALRETISDLEAFSYSLSHDLRAPLRAIRSLTGIFLEEHGASLNPEGTSLLTRALDAAQRMDGMVQDILAFSRVSREQPQLEPVDPEKLVRELISERLEFQPPRADIRIESPLLSVQGHAALLTQCLANLLGNAVKFVARGTVPFVRIGSEAHDEYVRLWIEDNGIGIPAEAQQKVFEIFQRLHSASQYEGSGIGLAIVRKAVERMGGRVGVGSEPGKGSRFYLELRNGHPAKVAGTSRQQ